MTAVSTLADDVRAALSRAGEVFAGSPAAERISMIEQRLDEPLRVAIAGRVKAGKSTLLNALVGEELATTDAGECTRIVTWYQRGDHYRVTLRLRSGESRHATFERNGGAIDVDLGGLQADDLERIEVEWPSQALEDVTLIDTPGIASTSFDVSERTREFLAPSDEAPAEADAVLYLIRHLHSEDVNFLEAFHDDEVSHASPVNAIAVLSRADEIGVGRLTALATAQRIADRYRGDPKVRRLCQTVVPVAGLLAETGATLTQGEYDALATIAGMPRSEFESMMWSTDRFLSTEAPSSLTPIERHHLLTRLGMFGIRVSVTMIRQKITVTARELAEQLVVQSGLDALRTLLLTVFAERRDVLKARSALNTLEVVIDEDPERAGAELVGELERIRASAHELVELRVLNALRSRTIELDGQDMEEAERLIGGQGTAPRIRLALDAEATDDDIRSAALFAAERWRRIAESPFSSREVAETAQTVVRSCEGLVAATMA